MDSNVLAPSFPQNVAVEAIDETSLNVTWLPPSPANGKIKFYQVFYDENMQFAIHNLTKNVTTRGTELSAVITELTPYSTYTVTVGRMLYLRLTVHV